MHSFLAFAPLSPFITAYSQSDFLGKLIMLALLFVSAVCWVVLVYKLKAIRNAQKLSVAFMKQMESSKENLLGWKADPSVSLDINSFYKIFGSFKQKTLEILNKNRFFIEKQSNSQKEAVYLTPADLDLLEAHVLLTISAESKQLEKNVFILPTIAALAPFLGLLGTVWGILVSFSELHGGAAASHNSVILGGLSMALATTVMGLVIAIPALIATNLIKNDLRTFSSDMQDFLGKLISTVELQYRRVDMV